jgi:hypothetical protein
MTNKVVHIRELLAYSTEQLFDMCDQSHPEYYWFGAQPFTLVFDNNDQLVVNGRQTVFSSYCWEPIRKYPNIVTHKGHHLTTVLNGRRLSATTHLDLIGNVVWDIYSAYQLAVPHYQLLDEISRLAYQVTNNIYNGAVSRLDAYVTAINVLDLIEIMRHPEIVARKEAAKPNHHDLYTTKRFITKMIADAHDFDYNPIAIGWRCSLTKKDQVYQVVGFREFLADISGHLFWRVPIMRGFGDGIRLSVESAVEARSSSKALDATTNQIKTTEYFSRRMQLLCQTLRNLHHGDCGTKCTMRVRIGEGEVGLYAGVNYYDEEEPTVMKYVRTSDDHLIGKVVHMRVPHLCAHKDNYGICSTCLGKSASSIPEFTNIGQLMATHLTRIISQAVLSTKHLDANAESGKFKIHDVYKEIIGVTPDNVGIFLQSKFKTNGIKDLKLVINGKEAQNLPDVLAVENVSALSITQISQIKSVILVYTDRHDVQHQEPIIVSQTKRLASLSLEFLAYVREHKWEPAVNGSYVIDLTHWDWENELPILILPMVQFNMTDHANAIAKMIESSSKFKEHRAKGVPVDGYVLDLFNLVNSKLAVNFSIIATIAYATMIRSAEKGDYALPKPWTEYGIGVKMSTFENRSGAALLAFERVYNSIISPNTYLNTIRPDHPMDWAIVPEKVLAANKALGHITYPLSIGQWNSDILKL